MANQCPICGANLTGQQSTCPACGAPLDYAQGSFENELQELVERTNQKLVTTGTQAAESAFGLGCSLGTILGLIVIGLSFLILRTRWTLLAIITLGIVLVAAGAASILASRAKAAMISGTYRREVEPEIRQFMVDRNLQRSDFDRSADRILGPDDPLRKHLSLQIGFSNPPEE